MKTKKTEPEVQIFFKEIECNYRPARRLSDLPKIAGSKDCFDNLLSVWSDKVEYIEEFVILCLNRANRLIGWAKISQGGTTGTVADAKVIFQIALKSNASSIILSHNHPSGNTQPSEADIHLTRKLKEGGQMLDICVLDHIIMAGDTYFSFADEGLI